MSISTSKLQLLQSIPPNILIEIAVDSGILSSVHVSSLSVCTPPRLCRWCHNSSRVHQIREVPGFITCCTVSGVLNLSIHLNSLTLPKSNWHVHKNSSACGSAILNPKQPTWWPHSNPSPQLQICQTYNCRHSIDAHFQVAAGCLLLMFLLLKPANIKWMDVCNQSENKIPKLQRKQLLKILWLSFSESCAYSVAVSVAYNNWQYGGYA